MGNVFAGPEKNEEESTNPQEIEEALKNQPDIDRKIVQALKRKKSQLVKENKLNLKFDRILLKFQSIGRVVQHIREVFAQFDNDSDQTLNEAEFLLAAQEMNVSLSKEELNELFEASDLKHEHRLGMKQFIVLLCISNVLHVIPELEASTPEPVSSSEHESAPNSARRKSVLTDYGDELRQALDLIVCAYLLFDTPVNGYINRMEVANVFETESSKQSHASHGFFTDERWGEMDVDQSGFISFEEFVFCFSNWVGVEDEDEDMAT